VVEELTMEVQENLKTIDYDNNENDEGEKENDQEVIGNNEDEIKKDSIEKSEEQVTI
jgi:hypothetical protein